MDEFFEMGNRIYEASKDMDWADYEDQKEQGINDLALALFKVKAYASYNEEFAVLFEALNRIYG